jgi:transcriptional regulator with XRE-family HTH domain
MHITNRNVGVAVTLGQKIRYLRLVEGQLRSLDRPMTQSEVVRAVRSELGQSISQAYLSQIEGGTRPHLTRQTRQLLAQFFKVHPSYLIDDPEGYHPELRSQLGSGGGFTLEAWLRAGAEQFRRDAEVHDALTAIGDFSEARRALLLLHSIVEVPGLVDRLQHTLHPSRPAEGVRNGHAAKREGRSRRKST